MQATLFIIFIHIVIFQIAFIILEFNDMEMLLKEREGSFYISLVHQAMIFLICWYAKIPIVPLWG